ncbi:MAG: alkaline phosphatase family protein, partial [Burkholderiales bacterium]
MGPKVQASALDRINRFVVLMLENRSFDHVLGYLRKLNPAIAGMADTDFNYEDPVGQTRKVLVGRARNTALSFDPGHEFPDVQQQVRGPAAAPAPMSGFISSSAGPGGAYAEEVMGCFQADQLPVLSALARGYGLANYWYSPMPGPTWPNRFFAHAATSGGLTESPGTLDSIGGYDFPAGTIYDRLAAKSLGWRVYHGDTPQIMGIKSIRRHYLNPSRFRSLDKFQRDAAAGDLPEYTFIEPVYDAFNDFSGGNSMHPLNDVARGEQLVKDVYEAMRASRLWMDTMLIVTFDEHGGFYDHLLPPGATPTGDDTRYATPGRGFRFDRYGVRVPAIVVSAYTSPGTVIGTDANAAGAVFDHSSILATVEKRFGLESLTLRDAGANTLETFLDLGAARGRDAPAKLPVVKKISLVTRRL